MAASGADGGGTVDLTAFTSLFQDMLSAGIAKATAPLYEKLGAMQHQIESQSRVSSDAESADTGYGTSAQQCVTYSVGYRCPGGVVVTCGVSLWG